MLIFYILYELMNAGQSHHYYYYYKTVLEEGYYCIKIESINSSIFFIVISFTSLYCLSFPPF